MSAADIEERIFVSRYSNPTFALDVYKAGDLADADGNEVLVKMEDSLGNDVFVDEAALHTDTGKYEIILPSTRTSAPGIYTLTWTFEIDGIPQSYVTSFEVGVVTPAYDALSTGFKGIVESVWWRFADLFDSPDGGPHLLVYYQSHFGRGRLAQLMNVALGKLNTFAQPHMTYTLDEQRTPFPYDRWGPILDQALYIETIKHLMRSYVEIPVESGVPVAYLDRRDYLQRWQTILEIELRDWESAIGNFKMSHMGLGRPHVLVSGGIYGNFGPDRLPILTARPRFWARFSA